MKSAGTNSNDNTNEKSTPNAMATTIGLRKDAWTELSKIMGVRPTNVVNDVKNMGLNLVTQDSITA